MTQFSVLNWRAAKCLHVAKREENHGDEKVDAMTINLRMPISCMEMDAWFGLQSRLQWYQANQTATVPGVEPVTTELRSTLFQGPYKMGYEGIGYVFSMRRGAGHSDLLAAVLNGADLKRFLLNPKQGGSCELDLSANVSGLDEETMGRLCGMGGRDVEVMFAPPSVQEGTMPESQAGKGKKGGAGKVHSAQGALIVDPADEKKPEDPTGAFLDVHGEKPMSEKPSDPPAPAPKPSGMARAIHANEVKNSRAKTKGRGNK